MRDAGRSPSVAAALKHSKIRLSYRMVWMVGIQKRMWEDARRQEHVYVLVLANVAYSRLMLSVSSLSVKIKSTSFQNSTLPGSVLMIETGDALR